jgi:hypothetical protein
MSCSQVIAHSLVALNPTGERQLSSASADAPRAASQFSTDSLAVAPLPHAEEPKRHFNQDGHSSGPVVAANPWERLQKIDPSLRLKRSQAV